MVSFGDVLILGGRHYNLMMMKHDKTKIHDLVAKTTKKTMLFSKGFLKNPWLRRFFPKILCCTRQVAVAVTVTVEVATTNAVTGQANDGYDGTISWGYRAACGAQ